jgi:molybdopterin-guanine dinucleotide biosynthesis protein A
MFPGVILAGGNARRLGGKGKALIKINGFPLINLVLQKFESQVSKVAINTRDKNIFSLNNLVSHVVVVPVDTPLLPKDLVHRMSLELEINKPDIIFSSSNNNIYPVVSMWSLKIDSYLDQALHQGVRKIDSFTSSYNVSILDWSFNDIDPFFNINSPEDVVLAEKYIKS